MEGKWLEGRMQLTDKQKSHDVLYLHELDELLSSLRDAGLVVEQTQTFRESSKEKSDLLICIQDTKFDAKLLGIIQDDFKQQNKNS